MSSPNHVDTTACQLDSSINTISNNAPGAGTSESSVEVSTLALPTGEHEIQVDQANPPQDPNHESIDITPLVARSVQSSGHSTIALEGVQPISRRSTAQIPQGEL